MMFKEEKKTSLQKKIPNVSRETFEAFLIYEAELKKWQKLIHLVSTNDLDSVWQRHILDSLEFYPHVQSYRKNLIDIGSGGGFPAIVLAILKKYQNIDNEDLRDDLSNLSRQKSKTPYIFLIESQQKKTAFLQNIVTKLGLDAKIYPSRIETLSRTIVEDRLFTARALASLEKLCAFIFPLISENPNHIALFAKGQTYEKEIEEAQKTWDFSVKIFPTKGTKPSVILELTKLKRRNQ